MAQPPSLPTKRQYDPSAGQSVTPSEIDRADFFSFTTRPDIVAPRWNIKAMDKDALAPGYWFVATYEFIEIEEYDNRSWFGPYIYDQDGELVWSGASTFEGYNFIDFKMSRVDHDDMLTGIYTRKNVDIVLNNQYEVHKVIPVESYNYANLHSFATVDNGTRFLAMTQRIASASEHELAHVVCNQSDVYYQGFEERDTETLQLIFEWTAQDHIPLNESSAEPDCSNVYDYLHANSVDKFPDGDYLLSARFTDTLYKISGKDGSIVWRLGGNHSDFAFDHVPFCGQHDAQVMAQNDGLSIISLLDNAFRPPHYFTANQSRGMVIAVHTDTMTAELLSAYNHPRASYAIGRGNFQTLQNGNAFLGWWNHGLISEHSPNGGLLMEASWKPELRSYRSYKFNWKGFPAQPPSVFAKAGRDTAEVLQTLIYVSWNGATEVESWTVHETDIDGRTKRTVTADKKEGFETLLIYNGFAKYVTVTGYDRHGSLLGESLVFETIISGESIHNPHYAMEQVTQTPQWWVFNPGVVAMSIFIIAAALWLLNYAFRLKKLKRVLGWWDHRMNQGLRKA